MTTKTFAASAFILASCFAVNAAPGNVRGKASAPAGADSLRLSLVRNATLDLTFSGEEKPVRILMSPKDQLDEHEFISYAARAQKRKALPKADTYENAMMHIQTASPNLFLNFSYYYLPHFHKSGGLYEHATVVERMPRWQAQYEPFEKRMLNFDFRYDAATDCTLAFLDGQYVGRSPRHGHLTEVSWRCGEEARIETEWYKAPAKTRNYTLPPLKGRSGDLAKSAKLKLSKKLPFELWPVEQSIDQSLHARSTYKGNFGWNPFFDRNPFEEDVDYFHWTVPNDWYQTVYVVCADIPEAGKVPILGTRYTRFGLVNRGSVAEDFTDLSGAATNRAIRAIGSLEYVKDGKKLTTPLYLVRHRLEFGKILSIINDKRIWGRDKNTGEKTYLARTMKNAGSYMDFEFIGAGSDATKASRSSVHIFGAALAPSPYAFDVAESERGNIFENDEKPETGWEITAFQDDTRGSIDYRIYDDGFKTLKTGTVPFTVAKKGETKRVAIDLAMPEVGWYGIDFTLRDAKGAVVANHTGAFTLLGANDREAGYESPYAVWPQLGGHHNSNPNNDEVAKFMRKAGYHSSWYPPVESEADSPDYAMTLSSFAHRCKPPVFPKGGHFKPYTAEEKAKCDAFLEEVVTFNKELEAKYPHCKSIQLLHECGGRDADKVLFGAPAVRGEYKGADSGLAYWCTEYAKRMKKEFPEHKISVGNGSSASQLVADLCRAGFDLNLIDELGIESKGFSSMPELPTNRESPGMLWALRETARLFGFTNFTMNACNEYVFRPEREVTPELSEWKRMMTTAFSLRDYLLSLAWGCRTISTGHPEDCFTPYYESNWGAGGQCKFFPYSYPKRLFTALANFTKVFDKAKLTRRIPSGSHCAYALEFVRDRKHRDYASAFWTPQFPGVMDLTLGSGKAEIVDWQGRRRAVSGMVSLAVGPTPVYLISDSPVVSCVWKPAAPEWPRDAVKVMEVHADNVVQSFKEKLYQRGFEGSDEVRHRKFNLKAVADAEMGCPVTEVELVKEGSLPALCREGSSFSIKESPVLDRRKVKEVGVWVYGDGAFGKFNLFLDNPDKKKPAVSMLSLGYRGMIDFEGWRLLRAPIDGQNFRWGTEEFRIAGFSLETARQALDPIEMAPVVKNLKIGPIVAFEAAGESATDKTDAAMRQVDDRDL